MQIAEGNPDPVEEYLGEASEIVRRLRGSANSGQTVDREYTANVVADVFASEFDVTLDGECVDEIVTKILAVVTNR
jgi:hypothetical protein